MAKNLKLTDLAANTEADALAPLFNTGWIRIYDGTQPVTADTAIVAQVLLAELRFSATAFGAAVAGVLTANAITSDTAANNTGVAAWYRCFKVDGITAICDGSVGTATADMILNSVAISSGATVSCSAFTHTVTK
jgi:hypothetical protein